MLTPLNRRIQVFRRLWQVTGDVRMLTSGDFAVTVGLEPGRKYPAVLEIHGGPMSMYSSAFFSEFQLAVNNMYSYFGTSDIGYLDDHPFRRGPPLFH